MSFYTDIKNEAKSIYKTNFGRNAGIGFVAFVLKAVLFIMIATVQFLCSAIYGSGFVRGIYSLPFTLLYILVVIFVVLPINTGLGTYFAKISKGIKSRTDNIFEHYKSFNPHVVAQVFLSVIILAELLFHKILSGAVQKILSLAGVTSGAASVISGFAIFAVIAALVIYTLITYSSLTYVIENGSRYDALGILNKSAALTKKNRGKIFLLILSFSGYILLSLLTLGIGFIWLNPYINISLKLFFSKLERGL